MSAMPAPWYELEEEETNYSGYSRIVAGTRTVAPYRSILLHLEMADPRSIPAAMLDEMTGLDANWAALGSAPPNDEARATALNILDKAHLMGFREPTYVTASAEGGVAIVFRSESRYTAIECLNDGEIYLLWYDDHDAPQSRQIAGTAESIQEVLTEVTTFHADA